MLELIATEEEWDLETEVAILRRCEKEKEIIEEYLQVPNEPEGVTVIPVYTLNEWGNGKNRMSYFLS